MPDEQERHGIEFLESGAEPEHGDFPSAPPTRNRRVTAVVIGLFAAMVLAGLVIKRIDRPGHSARSAPRPSLASSLSPPSSVRPAPLNPSAAATDPRAAARSAVAQLCPPANHCTVRAGAGAVVRRARATFGPLSDLTTLSVGPGIATIVAVLTPDGAQLLAIATRRDHTIDPAKLAIRPPIGVQNQRNGPDRLIAVVSGTVDAVALLGRLDVQNWLSALRAG